jgi:hypothetical protein
LKSELDQVKVVDISSFHRWYCQRLSIIFLNSGVVEATPRALEVVLRAIWNVDAFTDGFVVGVISALWEIVVRS